jgi:hypothetical protein
MVRNSVGQYMGIILCRFKKAQGESAKRKRPKQHMEHIDA